jgi:23S rRNA (cytidine1920-2'-O)/16S rRNA (cytidine1409-2'-O)-methyltransferase
LIKPQFEVGREKISEGIAKQADSHEQAINQVLESAKESGLVGAGIMLSPITGEAGNKEYLCWLRPTELGNQTQWTLDIHTLTHS